MTKPKETKIGCNRFPVDKHRILYCSLKWDYAEPNRGLSYEALNLEAGLRELAGDLFDLEIFYIDQARIQHGQDKADCILINLINEFEPTVLFHTSFDDNWDIDPGTLLWAKQKGINTVLWNCDCSWRFIDYILPRRDRYTHFITTHKQTIPWFEEKNMKVIRSQWAGSSLYTKYTHNLTGGIKLYDYDVSFVGQKHGIRTQMVDALNQAGVKVHLFGNYWDGHPDNHGFISFNDMIDVFNSSKINLNFSNPFRVGTMPQIKGRHFEVPQCGGFQLTTPADDIESYFMPDREIVIVDNMLEMVNKIRYYLEHNEEREQIAEAGYQRMLGEHQWKHRFVDILREINNEY